jgi:hypothetical protein
MGYYRALWNHVHTEYHPKEMENPHLAQEISLYSHLDKKYQKTMRNWVSRASSMYHLSPEADVSLCLQSKTALNHFFQQILPNIRL